MTEPRTYPHGVPCWVGTEWTKTVAVQDSQGARLVLSQFTPPEGS